MIGYIFFGAIGLIFIALMVWAFWPSKKPVKKEATFSVHNVIQATRVKEKIVSIQSKPYAHAREPRTQKHTKASVSEERPKVIHHVERTVVQDNTFLDTMHQMNMMNNHDIPERNNDYQEGIGNVPWGNHDHGGHSHSNDHSHSSNDFSSSHDSSSYSSDSSSYDSGSSDSGGGGGDY